MNIILAIDPGYDRCGVALVTYDAAPTLSYSTCIVTNKKDTHETRLAHIYTVLLALIDKWKPTHVALETLFFSVNKKTALKVAESRGVVVLVAGLHTLPLIELSPQAVKQGITGVGNADKKQLQKMVSLTTGIDITGKLDDEIDAIALAFAAAQTLRVQQML